MKQIAHNIVLIFIFIEVVIQLFKGRKKKGFTINSKYSQTAGLVSSLIFIFVSMADFVIKYKDLFALVVLLIISILFVYFIYRIHSRIKITFRKITYENLKKILFEALDKTQVPYKATLDDLNEDSYIEIENGSGKIKIRTSLQSDYYEIIFIKMNNNPYINDILDNIDELYIAECKELKESKMITFIFSRILYIGLLIAILWLLFNFPEFLIS